MLNVRTLGSARFELFFRVQSGKSQKPLSAANRPTSLKLQGRELALASSIHKESVVI
jgi:hypothetical protein